MRALSLSLLTGAMVTLLSLVGIAASALQEHSRKVATEHAVLNRSADEVHQRALQVLAQLELVTDEVCSPKSRALWLALKAGPAKELEIVGLKGGKLVCASSAVNPGSVAIDSAIGIALIGTRHAVVIPANLVTSFLTPVQAMWRLEGDTQRLIYSDPNLADDEIRFLRHVVDQGFMGDLIDWTQGVYVFSSEISGSPMTLQSLLDLRSWSANSVLPWLMRAIMPGCIASLLLIGLLRHLGLDSTTGNALRRKRSTVYQRVLKANEVCALYASVNIQRGGNHVGFVEIASTLKRRTRISRFVSHHLRMISKEIRNISLPVLVAADVAHVAIRMDVLSRALDARPVRSGPLVLLWNLAADKYANANQQRLRGKGYEIGWMNFESSEQNLALLKRYRPVVVETVMPTKELVALAHELGLLLICEQFESDRSVAWIERKTVTLEQVLGEIPVSTFYAGEVKHGA